jgi:hypothetical protein
MRPSNHDLLGQALVHRFQGLAPEISQSRQRPWASATFSGARHHYKLGFNAKSTPAQIDALRDRLACDEFALHRAIVADIVMHPLVDAANQTTCMIEALTVETQ